MSKFDSYLGPETAVASNEEAAMAESSSGGRLDFLGSFTGEKTVRFVPSLYMDDDGNVVGRAAPYRTLKLNAVVNPWNGKFLNALDGDYASDWPAIFDKAVESGRLTQDDVDKYTSMGDPAGVLIKRLKDMDVKAPNGLWPKTRFIFVVLNRDKGDVPMWWETGREGLKRVQSFYEGVDGAKPKAPNMFKEQGGSDVTISTNGEKGSDKRYILDLVYDSEDVEYRDEIVNANLLDGRRAFALLPYALKVWAVLTKYADEAKMTDLSPESFGYTWDELNGMIDALRKKDK